MEPRAQGEVHEDGDDDPEAEVEVEEFVREDSTQHLKD